MIVLHLLSLTFVLFTVVRADLIGTAWIRGKVRTLDPKTLHTLHRNTWIGLGLMITTGLILFYPLREFLLTRPQFYAKMAFVVTLICNGFVIGHLQKITEVKEFKELTTKEKIPLFISGAVSTLAWLGAIAGGFYLL